MPYTAPSSMTAGQVFTASRWNTQVKDNFDMLASLANDGTLAWDNTNKRLGVGTASPAEKLHVTMSTAGRTGIKFENTHGTSKSCQFNFGGSGAGVSNFSIGNDLPLNGTKDLYIYDNAAATTRLYISATGSLLVGKTSGLTGAGDIDANGDVKGVSFQTAAGNKWTLGTFSFGTFAQAGYVTVTINGGSYRLMAG